MTMNSFLQHHHHFFNEITIIGLREMYKSNYKLIKILWIFFLLFGGMLTWYYIYYVVEDYMNNSIVTKVYYEVNDTYQFPETYIVAELPEYSSRLTNLSVEGMAYVKSLLVFNPSSGKNLTLYEKGKEDFGKFSKNLGLQNVSDLFLMLKPDLDEQFEISCSNCGNVSNGYVAYYWINWLYFRIPYNLARPVSHIWYNWGYTADVSMHNPNQGLYLSIGRPYYQSFPNEYYILKVNFTYEFRIDAKRIKRHEKKSRNCLKVRPTNSDCLDDCFVNMFNVCAACTYTAFGNKPIFADGYTGFEICSNLKHDFLNCFDNQQSFVLTCHKNCLPICDEIIYSYSVIATPSITDIYGIQLQFQLMFTDTGFLTLEEVQSYSIHAVVSNIGGQLGLWLGLSAITIIQMLLFCLTRCLESKKKGLTLPNDHRVFTIPNVAPTESTQNIV